MASAGGGVKVSFSLGYAGNSRPSGDEGTKFNAAAKPRLDVNLSHSFTVVGMLRSLGPEFNKQAEIPLRSVASILKWEAIWLPTLGPMFHFLKQHPRLVQLKGRAGGRHALAQGPCAYIAQLSVKDVLQRATEIMQKRYGATGSIYMTLPELHAALQWDELQLGFGLLQPFVQAHRTVFSTLTSGGKFQVGLTALVAKATSEVKHSTAAAVAAAASGAGSGQGSSIRLPTEIVAASISSPRGSEPQVAATSATASTGSPKGMSPPPAPVDEDVPMGQRQQLCAKVREVLLSTKGHTLLVSVLGHILEWRHYRPEFGGLKGFLMSQPLFRVELRKGEHVVSLRRRSAVKLSHPAAADTTVKKRRRMSSGAADDASALPSNESELLMAVEAAVLRAGNKGVHLAHLGNVTRWADHRPLHGNLRAFLLKHNSRFDLQRNAANTSIIVTHHSLCAEGGDSAEGGVRSAVAHMEEARSAVREALTHATGRAMLLADLGSLLNWSSRKAACGPLLSFLKQNPDCFYVKEEKAQHTGARFVCLVEDRQQLLSADVAASAAHHSHHRSWGSHGSSSSSGSTPSHVARGSDAAASGSVTQAVPAPAVAVPPAIARHVCCKIVEALGQSQHGNLIAQALGTLLHWPRYKETCGGLLAFVQQYPFLFAVQTTNTGCTIITLQPPSDVSGKVARKSFLMDVAEDVLREHGGRMAVKDLAPRTLWHLFELEFGALAGVLERSAPRFVSSTVGRMRFVSLHPLALAAHGPSSSSGDGDVEMRGADMPEFPAFLPPPAPPARHARAKSMGLLGAHPGDQGHPSFAVNFRGAQPAPHWPAATASASPAGSTALFSSPFAAAGTGRTQRAASFGEGVALFPFSGTSSSSLPTAPFPVDAPSSRPPTYRPRAASWKDGGMPLPRSSSGLLPPPGF